MTENVVFDLEINKLMSELDGKNGHWSHRDTPKKVIERVLNESFKGNTDPLHYLRFYDKKPEMRFVADAFALMLIEKQKDSDFADLFQNEAARELFGHVSRSASEDIMRKICDMTAKMRKCDDPRLLRFFGRIAMDNLNAPEQFPLAPLPLNKRVLGEELVKGKVFADLIQEAELSPEYFIPIETIQKAPSSAQEQIDRNVNSLCNLLVKLVGSGNMEVADAAKNEAAALFLADSPYPVRESPEYKKVLAKALVDEAAETEGFVHNLSHICHKIFTIKNERLIPHRLDEASRIIVEATQKVPNKEGNSTGYNGTFDMIYNMGTLSAFQWTPTSVQAEHGILGPLNRWKPPISERVRVGQRQ